MTSEKVFTGIESDYEFFTSHSTEAECIVERLSSAPFRAAIAQAKSILDFGGGDGEFTSQIFQKLNYIPERMTLVEPATSYRDAWTKRFRSSINKISAFELMHFMSDKTADLIVANHVLYYVGNIAPVVAEHQRIAMSGASAIYSMATPNNSLIRMWEIGFQFGLGIPTPYNTNADLESVLNSRALPFERNVVASEFSCPDNLDNRSKLLRFLFKDHLSGFSPDGVSQLNKFMDACSTQGTLRLPLEDGIYLVQMGAL